MTIIPIGEWLPDQPDLDNPGATVAKNVIPSVRGYRPFKNITAGTSALDARCRGAFSVTDDDGNVSTYAGSKTKLYRLQSDNSWLNLGTATVGDSETRSYTKYGQRVIVAGIDHTMLYSTVGSSSTFQPLVSEPQARHLAVVRDFLVAGNTTDSVDGNVPQRVRWSAIGDPTDFTISQATQSDFQDLQGEGGWVNAVVGGEFGIIFQERSIWRMSYIGAPLVFQFDEIESSRGLWAPKGLTKLGNFVYFLSEEGFFVTDGATSQPIGDNKVDRYLLDEIDPSYLDRVVSAFDVSNKAIWWIYPTASATDGVPNRVAIYHLASKRWSYAEINLQWLFRSLAAGYTLDALDSLSGTLEGLDAIIASLDSRSLTGGGISLSGFDSTHKMGSFNGAALAATVTTQEFAPFPDKRAYVRNPRPLVDGATGVSVTPITRLRVGDSTTTGSKTTMNSLGVCPMQKYSRYFRFQIDVDAGGAWDFVQGVSFDEGMIKPGGAR